MISLYANQSVTWQVREGVNEYNEPTFSDGTTIKGRFEYKRKLVRKPNQEQDISEATLFTASPVGVGDRIIYDGIVWNVILSAPQRAFDGSVSFYEVSL